MPELPEVETVVRQLVPALAGRSIRQTEIHHPDLLGEPPEDFRRALAGSKVEGVSRRGKNIVLALTGPSLLVVNLGMTGQLLFRPSDSSAHQGEVQPRHLGVVFRLEPAALLLYADARRFGSLRRFSPADWTRESARLGPEPLERGLTGHGFHRRLSASRSPIRSWLLDQTRIAGIGNIYASEALFRAEIHPMRPAATLEYWESAKLLASIRRVLTEAIRARGTTLRDYRTASGNTGGFGPSLRAYGKEGAPCLRCKTPIERIVFGNRSAFFCPNCQPSP
jgi:formamidopyrimidine-DNA glycosylase